MALASTVMSGKMMMAITSKFITMVTTSAHTEKGTNMEKIYRVQMNKHGMPNFATAEEVVKCKDCRFKSLYDDGETHYYYCALEDRPNRQWSIDETDYCSWAEREGE